MMLKKNFVQMILHFQKEINVIMYIIDFLKKLNFIMVSWSNVATLALDSRPR
jgi:hypothetical protein